MDDRKIVPTQNSTRLEEKINSSDKTPIRSLKSYMIYDSAKTPQRYAEVNEPMKEDEFFLGVHTVLEKANNVVVEHDEFCMDLTPKSSSEMRSLKEELIEKARMYAIVKAYGEDVLKD